MNSDGNPAQSGGSPLGAALGVYSGVRSGTPQGGVRAAANAAKLYGAYSSNPAVSQGALGALNALNFYGGIKQGGVAGDTRAALAASQLAGEGATAAGATGLGTALGAAGPIGLALAPALIGLSTPAVSLSADWYNRANKDLSDPRNSQFYSTEAELNASGDPQELALLRAHGIQPYTPTYHIPAWAIRSAVPGGFQEASVARPNIRRAMGGNVKKNAMHSRLQELYKGSFASRPRHYDDGGYVSYLGDQSSYDPSSSYDVLQPGSGIGAPQVDTGTNWLPAYDPAQGAAAAAYQDAGGSYASNASNDPSGGSGSSVLGQGLSGLGNLLGVSSLGQLLQKYGALAPILSSALGSNKPASAPATPSGYGAIPSISTPSYSRPYTQPNIPNWYTYGQGPEQSFFGNNQLPNIPGVSPAPSPTGGAPQSGSPLGNSAAPNAVPENPLTLAQMGIEPLPKGRPVLARGGPTFDSTQGDSYVQDPGAGDGTSDDIDAKLSGGEYVMDAGTVSMLGNGSNEAGARALDQLRQRVRQHAGKHLVKGKQFMKAKPPEAYLKKGKP